MLESLESIFKMVVNIAILLLEAFSAVYIVVSAIKALRCLVRDQEQCKLMMIRGITVALGFLLGAEVLRTIIAPDWQELGMTCAILLMRAGITVLVHWEHKVAQEHEEEASATKAG